MFSSANSNQPYRNKGLPRAIGFVGKLVAPAATGDNTATYRRSRLLALLLLLMTIIFAIIDLIYTQSQPGYRAPWYGYLFLLAAYSLNWFGRYQIAARLTVLMFPIVIFFGLIQGNAPDSIALLNYLILSVMLATILLPPRSIVILVAINLIGISLVPLLAPKALASLQELVVPFALNSIGGILALTLIGHRNQVENDRQMFLKSREEQLRLALYSAKMGTWHWDIETNTVIWSEQVEAMFGLQPGQFKGTYKAYLNLIYPEDISLVEEAITTTLARAGGDYHIEHRINWPDGSLHWLEGKGRLDRDASGRPLRITGIVTDITDRKHAEAALSRQAMEMTALYQTALEINAQQEVATLLQSIVRRAATLLNVHMGTLVLLNAHNERLEVAAVHNRPQNEIGITVQTGEGVTGRVAQSGRPLMVDNYHAWSGKTRRFEAEMIGRIVGVPLKEGEQIVGVLNVFDEQIGTFDEDEVQLLRLFAGYATMVIQKARLFEAEQRQRQLAETMTEVVRVVNSSLELTTVLTQILEQVERIIKFDAAHILLIEGQTARMVAGRHFIDQEVVMQTPMPLTSFPISVKAIEQGKPLLVPDTHQDPLFSPPVRGSEPIRCIILVPLILRNEPIGVLSIISYSAHTYTNDDVQVTAHFAEHVIVAIKNAQLYEQTQQQNFELEESVAERTAELETAQDQLLRQERLAVLGKLAGSVGHELRNPLGVISNAVYFLRMSSTNADDTSPEYLDLIESRVQEATKIVKDLLNLSRSRVAERQAISVAVLLNEALQRYPPPDTISVRRLSFEAFPPVFVDPQQVGQVLANIIANAYHAMPDGGQLSLEGRKTEEYIVLTCTDTGVGMAADIIDQIFEPLFTTKPRGIGLGLAISKNLIEVNGGQITVESILGTGSTFVISLPIFSPASH